VAAERLPLPESKLTGPLATSSVGQTTDLCVSICLVPTDFATALFHSIGPTFADGAKFTVTELETVG
jgi:hypothetical protein